MSKQNHDLRVSVLDDGSVSVLTLNLGGTFETTYESLADLPAPIRNKVYALNTLEHNTWVTGVGSRVVEGKNVFWVVDDSSED